MGSAARQEEDGFWAVARGRGDASGDERGSGGAGRGGTAAGDNEAGGGEQGDDEKRRRISVGGSRQGCI